AFTPEHRPRSGAFRVLGYWERCLSGVAVPAGAGEVRPGPLGEDRHAKPPGRAERGRLQPGRPLPVTRLITLSNNAPQGSYQAGAVRDLGRPWPLGLGGRPRIPANETTNETAAESGRLTLASSSAGILLGLTRGKVARKAGRAASRRQSASGLCRGTGITLGDRDVREERAPSRLHRLHGAPPGSAACRAGRSGSRGSGCPPHQDGPQAWAVGTVAGSAA